MTTVQQTFQNKSLIGFLEWAELDVKECADKLCTDSSLQHIVVSPDVHSLHIVWVEPDGAICHEIADWPGDEVTVSEFLSEEIGDDSWECLDDEDFDNLIPDFGGEVKKLTLAELGIE